MSTHRSLSTTNRKHPDADEVKSHVRIEDVIGGRVKLKRTGDTLVGLCPFHTETTPSFTVYVGAEPHYKCYGCEKHGDVIQFIMEIERITFEEALKQLAEQLGLGMSSPGKGVTLLHTAPGLTVEALEAAKKLPKGHLQSLGVCNSSYNKQPAVAIPHLNEHGVTVAVQRRIAMKGDDRFRWRKGDKASLYGLFKLELVRKHGRVLFVEGASDCWTAWLYDIPAIGVPGKSNWQSQWTPLFKDVGEVFVWKEPGADECVTKIASDFPNLRVITAPDGIKDISEAHIQGKDVHALISGLMSKAPRVADKLAADEQARIEELRRRAASVLASEDPLTDIEEAIRALGYGGDITPPLITYIAATSRLLKMRQGTMPGHLLLHGTTSSGKTHTLQTVIRLLPEEAYYVIDASSPRVLIYDTASLQHRMLIFSEADSLPASEDNPAASAVRNLLQDNHLHYKVTTRNPNTGDWSVRDVSKPGPTVLVTTSTRRLGAQLESRMFILDMPDDQGQVRKALAAQAQIELTGAAEPSDAVVAYQALLQAGAPWAVAVPYADKLATAIGQSPAGPRIARDYSRLMSFIKSVALLRHAHRQKDSEGRIIASLADYVKVYDLVGDMYADSVTGASAKVREVVNAVGELKKTNEHVNVTLVAQYLGINKMAASRRITSAEQGGWLTNNVADKELRRNKKDLVLNEPLPPKTGLPAPESLDFFDPVSECNSVTAETGKNIVAIVQSTTDINFGGIHPQGNGVTPLQTS